MNQQALTNRLESIGYFPVFSTVSAKVLLREFEPGQHCGQIIFKDGECATLQSQDVQRVLNNEEIRVQKYTKTQLEAMTQKSLAPIHNATTGSTIDRCRNPEKAIAEILAAQDKVAESAIPTRPKKAGTCLQIWEMCDAMPGKSKAEVVAACETAGIKKSTASIQYGKWSKANASSN